MASTYVNDLRLNEMGTGDESGNWGVVTNLNLELIGEALSFGTEAITTNADTHTTTVADGATDPGRAMYLKYTGTLDSACTITIAPNTISRMHFIENGTSGSQNIIISQGSGANVTIPAGDTKAVYLDGAGSGAAVVDAFASLSTVDLKVQDDLTVTDDVSIGGALTLTGNGDFNGDLDVDGTTNLDVVDIDGAVDMASTLQVDGAITSSAGATITVNDNSIALSLISTDADANEGPGLVLYRNSSSPADNDANGQIYMQGENDADQKVTYSLIEGFIDDASDGTEDGILRFSSMVAGTSRNRMDIIPAATVFNEDSVDVDFRVESNGNANMLFVDGGNDRVGIGTASPDGPLHIKPTSGDTYVILEAGQSDGNAGVIYQNNSGTQVGYNLYDTDDNIYYIGVNGINRFTVRSGQHFELRGPDANSNQVKMMDSSGNLDGILYAEAEEIGFLDADGNWAMQVKKDNYVRFLVNNSEGLRLDSAGRLLQGVTSAAGISTPVDSNSTEYGRGYINLNRDDTASIDQILFGKDGVTRGRVVTTTATSYVTSSDYRMKENIDYTWDATTRLKQLKPARYNWIDDETNTLEDGFLAHEVSSIVPHAVHGEKDGDAMQGMDYGKLTPLLTKALQELEARVTTLEG